MDRPGNNRVPHGSGSDPAAWLAPLPDWLRWAEADWRDLDDETGHWGPASETVLAHCAHGGYLAACVLLASGPDALLRRAPFGRDALLARALKAYRHILGHHRCRHPSGGALVWGHHWGSPILVERIANFVDLLSPAMGGSERALWTDMLVSEANHHLASPIETNRFPARGETHAERNYWCGSVLFRAAREADAHPLRDAWIEKARRYWLNAFSVPADAACDIPVDGRPCRERFLGANVHPEFVFEHHGTVSADYTLITASFFVMLLLSALRRGWTLPQAAFHHMNDLWSVMRRHVLPNGAIAFPGGLKRPRYCLTQCWLLPTLLAWERFGGDAEAGAPARRVLEILATDLAASADGSFHSERCRWMRVENAKAHPAMRPYAYRLEADAVMSLGLAWLLRQVPPQPAIQGPTCGAAAGSGAPLRQPLVSRDAGLLLRRTDHGLFTVYWGRAATAEADPPLALCVPFANPHRAEWQSGLASLFTPSQAAERECLGWHGAVFDNGFATAAGYRETCGEPRVAAAIDDRLAFVLLPDGRSLFRLERATARAEVTLSELSSLNLDVPNDVFTGGRFTLFSEEGARRIRGLDGTEAFLEIASPWVNVENELGIVTLRGPRRFTLEHASARGRGLNTLRVDRLLLPLVRGPKTFRRGARILNSAVLLTVNEPRAGTEARARFLDARHATLPGTKVETWDFRLDADRRVLIAANLDTRPLVAPLPPPDALPGLAVVTPGVLGGRRSLALDAWQVAVFTFRGGRCPVAGAADPGPASPRPAADETPGTFHLRSLRRGADGFIREMTGQSAPLLLQGRHETVRPCRRARCSQARERAADRGG